MNKKIFTLLIILLSFACANADNGSNSPYSRYGIGLLSDQSLGVNRQMGGLGYGLYSSRYINILNPASFSQADTLTMLFEAGHRNKTNFHQHFYRTHRDHLKR